MLKKYVHYPDTSLFGLYYESNNTIYINLDYDEGFLSFLGLRKVYFFEVTEDGKEAINRKAADIIDSSLYGTFVEKENTLYKNKDYDWYFFRRLRVKKVNWIIESLPDSRTPHSQDGAGKILRPPLSIWTGTRRDRVQPDPQPDGAGTGLRAIPSPLPIKEQTNQKREIETMTNNILKFSTPYNLRQTEFFESYKLFDSIVDLSDSYINEIKSAFKEFIRGETKTETINNLLIRACFACYCRGAADEKIGRVIPLQQIHSRTEPEQP